VKKQQIQCDDNDASASQFDDCENQQERGGNACSHTKCGGDSVTKVLPGFFIKYAKRSKNGSQKFTTENKLKAGKSGVDNNLFAISNVKNPLFECKLCCIKFQTKGELNQHCSSQHGEAFHVRCVWQTIPALLLF
jgi:hypothetical protein